MRSKLQEFHASLRSNQAELEEASKMIKEATDKLRAVYTRIAAQTETSKSPYMDAGKGATLLAISELRHVHGPLNSGVSAFQNYINNT